MPIVNGQNVDAAVTNAAFIFKDSDDSSNAILGLTNGDAASGATLANVQGAINASFPTVSSLNNVSAAGSITIDIAQGHNIVPVIGSGAPVTMSTTPFGGAGGWVDGTIVKLVGTDSTDTVSIGFNDIDYGAVVNGTATLNRFESVDFVWVESLLRWVEISRNM